MVFMKLVNEVKVISMETLSGLISKLLKTNSKSKCWINRSHHKLAFNYKQAKQCMRSQQVNKNQQLIKSVLSVHLLH